jgi:hypothetical protein
MYNKDNELMFFGELQLCALTVSGNALLVLVPIQWRPQASRHHGAHIANPTLINLVTILKVRDFKPF